MLRNFAVALQFLTTVRLFKNLPVTDALLAKSALFFPFIGLLIGGMQALLFVGVHNALSPSLTALLLLLLCVIVTGAFHIEGFADMSDGFLSSKDREETLRIMRDSHVGVMGMVSVVCLLLAKFVFLQEIVEKLSQPVIIGILLLIPSLSRWAMVIAAGVSQYARPDPGLGRAFTEGVGGKIVCFSALAPAVGAVFFFQIWGIIALAITMLLALIMSRLAKEKVGGVTGDILGGINEITELALLIGAVIVGEFLWQKGGFLWLPLMQNF